MSICWVSWLLQGKMASLEHQSIFVTFEIDEYHKADWLDPLIEKDDEILGKRQYLFDSIDYED